MPEPVENLIKLIKIRLSATDAKISLIRETEDYIRIYSPYTQPEWKIINSKLPSEINRKIKYTLAPKTCQDGYSVLLLNKSYMNFYEIFNILIDLFYYINKIGYEYSNE